MVIILGCITVVLLIILCRNRRDVKDFDKKDIHKNGTQYDDFGYDANGYDRNGYDRYGFDVRGFDSKGYNKKGYNQEGKNEKGQYNRLYDLHYEKDGFNNPRLFPVIVTTHAKERIMERMPTQRIPDVDKLAYEAFCYGRSKRQLKQRSAAIIEEIESRYDGSVVLIYRGYIYVFSKDNKLITVYKNTRIPL